MTKINTILIISLIISCAKAMSQTEIINTLKDFYSKADFRCYDQKIQQDLNRFNVWLTDSLPILKSPLFIEYRAANIDLQKEKKIHILAVTFANTENYQYGNNIYNHIIIDSLRTFIVACVDDKMNLTGLTDISEKGTFIDLKDDFYYPRKKRRHSIRQTLKNINKENPDLILFCDAFFSSFLYVKNNLIYVYNISDGSKKELNEVVKECTDINIIRNSNKIVRPLTKRFKNTDFLSIFYRKTGHTPPDEVRICP